MTMPSAPPPPAAAHAAPAVAAPPLAPGAAPLCYVLDEEPSSRHLLSLVLHGAGIDTVEFSDGAALREAIARRAPELVFHNVSLEAANAIESVAALGAIGFRGAIQLMSSRGAAVLEHVKAIGVRHNLNMLPVLKKPFEAEAIVTIVRDLGLGTPLTAAARLGLDEALANDWVEFWYEPKIDLRKKRLAGAEAHVRVRHPRHGIVQAAAFMPGAAESSVISLSERALTSALDAGQSFAKLGINLPVSVNMPLAALARLPVEEIVRTRHPQPEDWAGLIIDVPEMQILDDPALATKTGNRLAPVHVRLAIDDAGRGVSALSRLSELPFAELKLDAAFVAGCGSDKVNAPVCKSVIDLAHNSGGCAVAPGIERAADAVALVSMGCDCGQGFLLGQPMPQERFIALLRQRAATQGHRLPA